MHNTQFMDHIKCAKDIVGERYYVGLGKLHSVREVEDLFEIVVHIIHDNKDVAKICCGFNVQQSDREYVFGYEAEMSHQLKFCDESLTGIFMSKNVGLLFDSHYLIVTLLSSFYNLAETTTSN